MEVEKNDSILYEKTGKYRVHSVILSMLLIVIY